MLSLVWHLHFFRYISGFSKELEIFTQIKLSNYKKHIHVYVLGWVFEVKTSTFYLLSKSTSLRTQLDSCIADCSATKFTTVS